MFKLFARKEKKTERQVINEQMDTLIRMKAELQSKVTNYLWPILLETSPEAPMKVDIVIDHGPALLKIKVSALWLDDECTITASTDIQDEVCFEDWFTLEEQIEIINQIKE